LTTSDSYDNFSNGAGTTIAATFSDRASAHDALLDLRDAGFHNVWLGVTHGEPSGAGVTVADGSSGGGIMESIGRFFSGEGPQEQALHRALIGRGLSDAEARRLEATVPVGSAIVTVESENASSQAIDILRENGGVVNSTYVADDVVTSDDAGVREMRRVPLREERLTIDKQRVAGGEARVRKDIVSEQQSIDVPVFREELFIERRPVTSGADSTTPIVAGEEIRIPLTQERVDVRKQTIVSEEVAIGKRKIEDTEHVSDTLRREELHVENEGQHERETAR